MLASDFLAFDQWIGTYHPFHLRYVFRIQSKAARSKVIPTTGIHILFRIELQLGCCEPLSWRRTTWCKDPSRFPRQATTAPSPRFFPSLLQACSACDVRRVQRGQETAREHTL